MYVFVRSIKRYSTEKVLEILREIIFPSYLTYTCVNDAYSDFIYRFVGAINFIAPSKKIRVKPNSKPWFDNQIVSAIQRRDKLYKKFKHSGLETDKDNFKVAKMHLQKLILKKKKSCFEEELGKNRNKPKELWKTLMSLGLSSDKARQSKTSLNKDGAIQDFMPRLHATYPMTLNFQTYLKMLKRFYLASIPVKPLEWTKYQQNF